MPSQRPADGAKADPVTSDWLAREQAALRRVATLVARGVRPDEIFSAVSEEVGRLFDCEAGIARFEPDGSAMIVVGLTQSFPVVAIGTRLELEDFLASTAVFRTGRAARSDDAAAHVASGPVAERLRRMGFVSTVDAPIVVEGSLWGVMTVSHLRESLPAGTEERVEKFTELVATAIANAEGRAELAASEARARNLAEEQAALRRVATLVARGVLPDELLAAVTREARRVLPVEFANLGRYEPDGTITFVAASPGQGILPVGSRWPLGGDNVSTAVARTGLPVRIDHYPDATGPIADAVRELGSRVAAGAPIGVEGRLWGVLIVSSTGDQPLPADIEARLADFTELVATAIANAENHAALAASRARVIAAADEARRRIERDLHDGAQQRLVTLALALRRAEGSIPAGEDALRTELARVADGLRGAAEELQEMSRGIHPSVVSEHGLSPALKALGRRSPVPVKLDARVDRRLPDQVEVAAYYIVSETLTNAAKHAAATRVWVSVRIDEDALCLSIRDDGVGGADPTRGSGLIGLKDRVEAIGGTIAIESPPQKGTRLEVEIPVDPNRGAEATTSAAAAARAAHV